MLVRGSVPAHVAPFHFSVGVVATTFLSRIPSPQQSEGPARKIDSVSGLQCAHPKTRNKLTWARLDTVVRPQPRVSLSVDKAFILVGHCTALAILPYSKFLSISKISEFYVLVSYQVHDTRHCFSHGSLRSCFIHGIICSHLASGYRSV